MKTAISLPDEVFEQSETYRKQQHLGRSELYCLALQQYLQEQQSKQITEQLNEVYSVEDSKLDAALENSQLDLLKNSQW